MTRQADHPVHPQFTHRWSPRAFTGAEIAREELMSLLEAARWAPSTSNTQPWRFVYGLRGTPGFEAQFGALVPFNQDWAKQAAVLITVISATSSVPPGKSEAQALPNHAFDTGAAWMSLALQAEAMGLRAHAMGGFDAAALRSALAVPADHAIHCVVAVGHQASPDTLPEALRARELPNGRRPLAELAREGRFS